MKDKVTIRPSKKAGCGFTLTINGKYIGTFGTPGQAKVFAREVLAKSRANYWNR